MLHHIIAAALTLAVLPPAPATTAPSRPPATPALKTIATVRASARCADVITHANGAITSALGNDQIIGQTITNLRYTNLDDGNELHRTHGLQALGNLAKALVMQARSGDDEVKRLRRIAAQTKDPDNAKALKTFADALGGALWTQQKIGRDLNGFLAYQDYRDMSKWGESGEEMNQALFGVPDPLTEMPVDMGPRRGTGAAINIPLHPASGHDPAEANATQQAKWAADDFEKRIPFILKDENSAANDVDGAITGC